MTKKAQAWEVNFDGLVGPTHNYSGLSYGNVASTSHRSMASNPREAALQGLRKMKTLSDLGLRQAVLPPQERPDLEALRRLGFSGTETEILAKASKDAPELLAAVSSASCMWTANAATVSPSADSEDEKVHFTPANLVSKFHRSLESATTARVLRKIFENPRYFAHHDVLPSVPQFGDEGAANHTRLCPEYGARGVEFFVFGRYAFRSGGKEPRRFPARQTFEASSSIAKLHQLDPGSVVYAQQSPEAIDAGVFHNDVVGVGNQNVYFCHEGAFLDSERVVSELQAQYRKLGQGDLKIVSVPASSVSMEDAVKSYLFNSQLIALPTGGMALVMPEECKNTPSVARYLTELRAQNSDWLQDILFFDLKQSMSNGGGPACLRLRVVLNESEMKAAHAGVFLTRTLYDQLVAWVKKHYRDRLSLEDLRDPSLLNESRAALDELTALLGLGSIYFFQSASR